MQSLAATLCLALACSARPARHRYQTDLSGQPENIRPVRQPDPYYQTSPYQEGAYQEPYKAPNYYQATKKQHQLATYQEPYVEEDEAEPKPFAYQYGGVDAQGLGSSKSESQGQDGVVRGEYRVQLPDGRTQIVSYTADEEHGYQAEVRYEGEARPEELAPGQAPNDYIGADGETRVRQYPRHTKQPYGRY